MSKQGGGFFDDDDDLDELPESYQTSNQGNEDSLSSAGFPSPRRYQTTTTDNGANGSRNGRASSATTAGRTGGRVSSVTGAAAGSSRRDYQSTRGGSPALDDDDLGDEGGLSRERNVQRLLKAWHNEMGAPELLRFPRELVERMVRDLARRVNSPLLCLFRSNDSSETRLKQKAIVRKAQTTPGQDEGFYTTAAIVATENMRAAHVLKMYTRERIYKVSRAFR